MPRKKNRKKQDSSAYLRDPLTERKARRMARRTSRMAVRPRRRQIKQERKAVKGEKKSIRQLFPQYQQQLAGTQQQAAAATQGAQQQVAGTSQAASGYAETLRQRLASEAKEDAARRGVAYDPKGSETFASADLARQNASNVLSGVIGAQGTSQQGFVGNLSAIAGREKLEQLSKANQRRRTYDQDLRALAREQGDIRRDEFSRTRDAERDYRLGLQAARLGKKGQKIGARETRRSQALTARQQGETQRHNLATEGAARRTNRRIKDQARRDRRQDRREGGGGGGASRKDLNRAKAYLNQGVKVEKIKTPEQKKKAIHYLVNRGVDPGVARRVVNAATKRRETATGQTVTATLND